MARLELVTVLTSQVEDVWLLGEAGGQYLLSVDDGEHGRELWVTDGTAEGLGLVGDIKSGADSSEPWRVATLPDGRVLFSADDGVHGSGFWITDGTGDGTVLLTDVVAPEYVATLADGRVLFKTWDLWRGVSGSGSRTGGRKERRW